MEQDALRLPFQSGLFARGKVVEEGLEKGICAPESRDLIFSCSFGEFSVCSPFLVVMGKDLFLQEIWGS